MMLFEWDPKKAISNFRKHGVDFKTALLVFADKHALSIFDEYHSDKEDRWITIGKIPIEKVLVVVHTDRIKSEHQEFTIRIISARLATKKEKNQYQSFYLDQKSR